MEQNERQLWAEAVAATLRAERAVAGLDHAAIARLTGIARSSYRFYEQAARNPDVVQLAMIAEAFGVTFAYLMSEVDRRAPRLATLDTTEKIFLDQLVLTEDEFAAKKADILGRI